MSGRAVLWRKRHKGRKVITRAVYSMILGGAVAFFGNQQGPLPVKNCPIGFISEGVTLPPPKDISVSELSRHKDWVSIAHDLGELFLGKRSLSSELEESFLTRIERRFGYFSTFIWAPHTSDGHDRKSMEIISGSLPIIFDLEFKDGKLSRTEVFDLCFNNADVRPQLAFGHFLSTANEIAGGHPKEDRRESQDNSKGNENFVLPVVDKVSETVSVSVGHDSERGEIIFRLIVGGLLLVLLYAGLKRW
jgi:hypothetical protein